LLTHKCSQKKRDLNLGYPKSVTVFFASTFGSTSPSA
jgi:hypothetical protein